MTDEPENATLRLLREMRERFDSVDESLTGVVNGLAELKSAVIQVRSVVAILTDQITEVSTRLTAHSHTLRNLADIVREREVRS